MVANYETKELLGNEIGEPSRVYTRAKDGAEVKVINRFYANGEHLIFQIGGKVVMVVPVEQITNEGETAEWCYNQYVANESGFKVNVK